MKILFVQPSPFEPGRLGLENSVWLSEPVALTSLARMLPDHDVKIVDLRVETDDVLNQVLLDFRPDLVGTTSMTTDCYHAKAILSMAKQALGESCFTIIGGHHPTLSPKDFEDPVIDAICIGEGEETVSELVEHLERAGSRYELEQINGLRFLTESGDYRITPPRAQTRNLDSFPPPARHLLPQRYLENYFFIFANPMASMETSRGCAFDCNFCAIWEFYGRKTRFLSAKAICDQLEQIPEKYVFFMDDNFLTKKSRLEELCDEIKKRKIKKYFLVQGRSDFVVDHQSLIRRLRDAGLMMVLSGYETNSESTLLDLRKRNTVEKNRQAAEILRKLGIISTGIFMVRQDFTEKDFDMLYETINEMKVANPIVTILTPLPGTQLFRKFEDQLLTKDYRLFDLLHSVLPTRLERRRFYEKYTQWPEATESSTTQGILSALRYRPKLFLGAIPEILGYREKVKRIRPILRSPDSHLRDEIGIIEPIQMQSHSKISTQLEEGPTQKTRPSPKREPHREATL